MLSPADAEAAIAKCLPLFAVESVPLVSLAGRVLREPVKLARDQPPFDRVTMDGIAFATAAWDEGVRSFRIAGVQAAGAAPLTLPSLKHCIEVMTGAMLPQKCDCVVPVEKLTILEGTATLNEGIPIAPWLNVHRRGLDGKAGATVLDAGTSLGAAETAVIASCGLASVNASVIPRIAVISTGDELVDPGQEVQAWQIWRSNSYAILAALEQHGFTRLSHDHLADDLQTLRTRLQQHLASHDVLVLSGGVSMGRFDLIPQVLGELGVEVVFHHVAQRPGKPMWFGTHPDGQRVYALPGNPVSTAVCLRRYVIPTLQAAMGARVIRESAVLGGSFKALPSLTSFVPVQLRLDPQGVLTADSRPTQGSGDFLSLLGTQGFVELSPQQHPHVSGAHVPLYRW